MSSNNDSVGAPCGTVDDSAEVDPAEPLVASPLTSVSVWYNRYMPILSASGDLVPRSSLKMKKSSKKTQVRRTKADRQAWWRSLSSAEQAKYIEKWERQRKAPDTSKRLPAPEEFGEGMLKLWIDHNSYKILKPYMWVHTEEFGYEEVHPDFWDARRYELAR